MNYTVIIVIGFTDIWIAWRDEFVFDTLVEAELFAEKIRNGSSEDLKKYCCSYDEFENEIIEGRESLKADEYTCWIAQYITDGDPDQCIEAWWAEEMYTCTFVINEKNEISIDDNWICLGNEYK